MLPIQVPDFLFDYERDKGKICQVRHEQNKNTCNLCLRYRFERLRDYARAPRPAACAESRNLSERYIRHKLVQEAANSKSNKRAEFALLALSYFSSYRFMERSKAIHEGWKRPYPYLLTQTSKCLNIRLRAMDL